MRTQYHFRHGPGGLLAWDVRTLIERTKDVPVHEVPLAAIRELDEPYWFDASNASPTCRAIATHMRLVDEADLAHPILLCPEGRVMDGMHRVVKALLAGRTTIRARRLATLPEPDHVGVRPDDLPYD